MKLLKQSLSLLAVAFLFLRCEEENDFTTASSLKVVHAATAPQVHVNYFGTELLFSSNPTLGYTEWERYTLPAEEPRALTFTYASDTNRQVLSEVVTLAAGEISTYYLLGDSANLTGFLLEDGFPISPTETEADSIVNVRFINLSRDAGTVNVATLRFDGTIVSGLDFQQDSDFIAFSATTTDSTYVFQFKDPSDQVLASASLDPIPSRGVKPVFKSLTYALIGQADDGEGNDTLQIMPIEHY